MLEYSNIQRRNCRVVEWESVSMWQTGWRKRLKKVLPASKLFAVGTFYSRFLHELLLSSSWQQMNAKSWSWKTGKLIRSKVMENSKCLRVTPCTRRAYCGLGNNIANVTYAQCSISDVLPLCRVYVLHVRSRWAEKLELLAEKSLRTRRKWDISHSCVR